jgi:ADP-ribose pyrophosphatase YjhB (NUDIX family)
MINNLSEFKKNYWGEDNSTEVMFHPANTLPNNPDNITSVMGAVFNDGNLLLTKPIRGWGLPGGHIEDNESPEECLKRECIEEADVEIGNLKLIGYWKTKKLKKLESNKKYPDEGYQLLYIADAIKVNDFVPIHEVSERLFIPAEEVRNILHNYDNFEEILKYVISVR